MITIQESIERCLIQYDKTKADIKFVAYYLGHYLQTRQKVYCGIEEFLNAIGSIIVTNLTWIKDVEIVGDAWWVEFDVRSSEWMYYTIPKQPTKYQIPIPDVLSIES